MRAFVLLGGLLLATGCAHRPPPELMQARLAYQHALEAREADPAGAYMVGKSLQRAEREYAQRGDSDHARSLAYVATRKAERLLVETRVARNEARLTALATSTSRDTPTSTSRFALAAP